MSKFEGVYVLKNVFSALDYESALADEDLLIDGKCVLENLDYVAMANNKRVLNAVQSLMGDGKFVLRNLAVETCLKGVDKRGWVVGPPYDNKPKTATYDAQVNGVRVIIPIDNFTVPNGCSMFVPNSHLARAYPTNERLLLQVFSEADDELKLHPCKKRWLECNLGDAIAFPSTVWHSRGVNTTDEPRRALVADFQRA